MPSSLIAIIITVILFIIFYIVLFHKNKDKKSSHQEDLVDEVLRGRISDENFQKNDLEV